MKEIKITSSGIKQAIDNLVNENELLQDKVYKQEDEIKILKEENQKLNECLVDMLDMNVEYSNAISHAIEYIEENLLNEESKDYCYLCKEDNIKIINILKEEER